MIPHIIIAKTAPIPKTEQNPPRNIKIIVKDHPAQLDLYHRDKFFNQRLKHS